MLNLQVLVVLEDTNFKRKMYFDINYWRDRWNGLSAHEFRERLRQREMLAERLRVIFCSSYPMEEYSSRPEIMDNLVFDAIDGAEKLTGKSFYELIWEAGQRTETRDIRVHLNDVACRINQELASIPVRVRWLGKAGWVGGAYSRPV